MIFAAHAQRRHGGTSCRLGVFWVRLRVFVGPRFTATATSVATDFRWWVGAVISIFAFLTFSPFVEQHRWPFTAVIHEAGGAAPSMVQVETWLPLSDAIEKFVPAELLKNWHDLQREGPESQSQMQQANQEIDKAAPIPGVASDDQRIAKWREANKELTMPKNGTTTQLPTFLCS